MVADYFAQALGKALDNKRQKEMIRTLATEEDWAFMRDTSGALGNIPTPEELRSANKLVLYKDLSGFQDGLEQGYSGKRKREVEDDD